jgi:hypothetical protein
VHAGPVWHPSTDSNIQFYLDLCEERATRNSGRVNETARECSEHVSLRRWERYGFDRLYGSADGRTVGWVDLGTGEERIEIPELAEAFGQAVEDWRNSHLIAGRPPTRPRQADGSPPPEYPRVNRTVLGDTTSGAVEEWTDLALNLPGAGPRAKAVEARRREPVWTLLARLGRCHNDERAWRLGARGKGRGARRQRAREARRRLAGPPFHSPRRPR